MNNIGVSSGMPENAYTRTSSLQERNVSDYLGESIKDTESAFGPLLNISKKRILV